MEQVDSDQWRVGRGILVKRRGRDYLMGIYEWPTDMVESVEMTVGAGGGIGKGG